MTAKPADILKKPYGRVVIPEPDGTFRAEIIEFPGCIAIGDTAQEALVGLESVAEVWLEAALDKRQTIPEPIEAVNFSGKLVVRMPKSLHKKAAHFAEREGVSLNQFILSSLAEHVGGKAASYYVTQYFSTIRGATSFFNIQSATKTIGEWADPFTPLGLPAPAGGTSLQFVLSGQNDA